LVQEAGSRAVGPNSGNRIDIKIGNEISGSNLNRHVYKKPLQ